MGHVITPLSAMVCHPQAGSYYDQGGKFEVSMSIRFGYKKSNAKVGNGVVWSS